MKCTKTMMNLYIHFPLERWHCSYKSSKAKAKTLFVFHFWRFPQNDSLSTPTPQQKSFWRVLDREWKVSRLLSLSHHGDGCDWCSNVIPLVKLLGYILVEDLLKLLLLVVGGVLSLSFRRVLLLGFAVPENVTTNPYNPIKYTMCLLPTS